MLYLIFSKRCFSMKGFSENTNSFIEGDKFDKCCLNIALVIVISPKLSGGFGCYRHEWVVHLQGILGMSLLRNF